MRKNVPTSEDIKNVIDSEIVDFNTSNLEEDHRFSDAGIDSLDHMDILFVIQEKYSVSIPDDAIEKCSSIAGIISYIQDAPIEE